MDDRLCLIVIIAVTEDGTKELVAVEDGIREPEASWTEILEGLRARAERATEAGYCRRRAVLLESPGERLSDHPRPVDDPLASVLEVPTREPILTTEEGSAHTARDQAIVHRNLGRDLHTSWQWRLGIPLPDLLSSCLTQ